ncbi:MAG: hypothetical protein ACAI44_33520 [Candidatus Sericytochromatia bacterium]
MILRKLRKHSRPIVTATVFFFVATIVVSLVFSLLGLFGIGQVAPPV